MSNGNQWMRKDGRAQPQSNINNMFNNMTTPSANAPSRSISDSSASENRDRAMLDMMLLRSMPSTSRSSRDNVMSINNFSGSTASANANCDRAMNEMDINTILSRDIKLRELLAIEHFYQSAQWNPESDWAANAIMYRQQQHLQDDNAFERLESSQPSRHVPVEKRVLNGDRPRSVDSVGPSVVTVTPAELASDSSDDARRQISTEKSVALVSSSSMESTSDSSKMSESNTEDGENIVTQDSSSATSQESTFFFSLHHNHSHKNSGGNNSQKMNTP